MKVSFTCAENALFFGAPTPEEQRGLLELAKGNLGAAEEILDKVVAEHPERARNISLYFQPGIASNLMLKYVLQSQSIAAERAKPLVLLSSSFKANVHESTAPPAYEESEAEAALLLADRNSAG
jgi:hypothetical protein